MNSSRALGFAKEAGLGDVLKGAVGKVKSLFSAGSHAGPMTIKLKPRAAVAAAPAATPKMSLIQGGGGSIHTPMHTPTPTQMQNTRIRSEMKRGVVGA